MTSTLHILNREEATRFMAGLDYTSGAIETYLRDASRGGSVHPIGPVIKISYARKSEKFLLDVEDEECDHERL